MPVRRDPRSGDGVREPERSDGQWRGKTFCLLLRRLSKVSRRKGGTCRAPLSIKWICPKIQNPKSKRSKDQKIKRSKDQKIKRSKDQKIAACGSAYSPLHLMRCQPMLMSVGTGRQRQRQLRAVIHMGQAQYLRHIQLDGVFRDAQIAGNLVVGLAFTD